MKTAADIMTTNPVTVTRDTTLRDAARLLLDGHFNGLPVRVHGYEVSGRSIFSCPEVFIEIDFIIAPTIEINLFTDAKEQVGIGREGRIGAS